MAMEHAVAEKLRRRMLDEISSGALPADSRLGGERELAEHYDVSRGTLRQVLATLEEAGLVRRVPGRGGGTFISHAKVEHDLTKVVGVPAYLARQGYTAGTRVISSRMTVADAATAQALKLPDSAVVIDLQRLRLADGSPFSLESAKFAAERFPGLLEMPLGGSIYELLEKQFDTVPADAEETIEVVSATDEEAALLSVDPKTPLLSITRTAFDSEGMPFEFSHDLFRADRTRITMRTPGRGLTEARQADNHFARISSVP